MCSSDESPVAEADEVPLIMNEQTGFDTDEHEYLMRSRSSRRLHRKSVMYYICDAWIEACARFFLLFLLVLCVMIILYDRAEEINFN